jgi:hypothetical protein
VKNTAFEVRVSCSISAVLSGAYGGKADKQLEASPSLPSHLSVAAGVAADPLRRGLVDLASAARANPRVPHADRCKRYPHTGQPAGPMRIMITQRVTGRTNPPASRLTVDRHIGNVHGIDTDILSRLEATGAIFGG